jgi:hypothetical protein
MKVSIHQPNFIPWIGYFYKIACSDCFVFLDDVEYTKNSFINRNKIKTPLGAQWLTLPVNYAGNSHKKINTMSIIDGQRSFQRILKTLTMNYSKSINFKKYIEIFENIFNSNTSSLSEINILLIKKMLSELKINTKVLRSSELIKVSGESTFRLASICKEIGGTTYISGFGGKNYQLEDIFTNNGINSIIYNFKHPVYNQLWGEFISNLSIVDLLFNHEQPSNIFKIK